MPSEVRRRAKAINFGIIYGISAFGLANQLGIARNEAGDYIRKYFERFPGIRDYMEATKKIARANGYVTTLFGRKCHYPRINASNPSERAFNERAAINAPLQGSAADIIRRAMVRMDDALAKAGLSAQMLLTVHDELVFEAPDERSRGDAAGRGQSDGRCAGARGEAARAAESRRARGAELGRGALAPAAFSIEMRHCEPQASKRPSFRTGFGEAIKGPRPYVPWIASSLRLLAMTRAHDRHRRALPRARFQPQFRIRPGAGEACAEARRARGETERL